MSYRDGFDKLYIIERTEEKLLELISRTTKTIFGYERVELEKNAPEALKMLFKEKSGDGYVAYLMTYWYGSIATESLLHIDANGCVRNLDILDIFPLFHEGRRAL